MATTSKEGSRRVNYSVPIRRGSDDEYRCLTARKGGGNWNGHNPNSCASNNWRASLVPAAAVIPAPRVYTKVVAVKKLVVNFWGFVKIGFPKGKLLGSGVQHQEGWSSELVIWGKTQVIDSSTNAQIPYCLDCSVLSFNGMVLKGSY